MKTQRISIFMPQRMSDDEVENLFVVRQDILEYLIRSLNGESSGSIPQHHLLIGQRGMGKTTLLRRVDVELHKEDYKRKFISFTFPEEQYNIDRLSKFWLNSLDALADTLQVEGSLENAYKLDNEIEKLSNIRDEQQLSKSAYSLLKNTTDTLKRRPVFLIDNINLIFDRLGESEQSRLRKIINDPGAPIFIGASATIFDNSLDYDAPFYDAFDVHFLEKLQFDQTLLLLRHLANITQKEVLQFQLKDEYITRLKTLHALSGGNVRTVVILFSLVSQGFSVDVFVDLEALIDQMTPLYKSRFEELSKQSQVVIDAIALNWDPSSLENIREKTVLENGQLSVQLDRLIKAGWISRLGKRKATRYEISERFFNVWYLMRRSSRRQRRDLLWLTRFLQAWFTKDELREHIRDYSQTIYNKCNPHEISFALALARATKDDNVGKKLLESSYKRLIEIYDGDSIKIERIAGVDPGELNLGWISEYKNTKLSDIFKEAAAYIEDKKYENAERLLLQALELDNSVVDVWLALATLYTTQLAKFEDAENAYIKATLLDNKDEKIWIRLGYLYGLKMNRYEDSEKAFKQALELKESDASTWEALGDLYYFGLKRYEDAEIAYDKAVQLGGENSRLLGKIGKLNCCRLQNYTKAEQSYLRAIDLDDKDARPWAGLGHLYCAHMDRCDEAERAYERAIELDPKDPNNWEALGNVLSRDSQNDKRTENAYLRGIELDENNAELWGRLGQLYSASPDRYKDAEDAFKRSIELDATDIRSSLSLANFYVDGLKNYQDAEQIYKRLILENENDARPIIRLGNLYYFELKQFKDAEKTYKQLSNLDLNDKIGISWNKLGNVLMDFTGDYQKAKEVYEKSVEEESHVAPKVNLVFLLRDHLDNIEGARKLYEESKHEYTGIGMQSVSMLHEATFALYDSNWNAASELWKAVLVFVGDNVPSGNDDDWYRSVAIAAHLGYGNQLLSVFEETGYNRIFRPIYESLKALVLRSETYISDEVAAEIRDVSMQILFFMKNYIRK